MYRHLEHCNQSHFAQNVQMRINQILKPLSCVLLYFSSLLSSYLRSNGVFTARKRGLGQGNIFSSVCREFCIHGGLPQCMLWYHLPPRSRHPPTSHHPWEQTPPPSRHPPSSACWEIRSISWWYVSYWNAILFPNEFHWIQWISKLWTIHLIKREL